MQGSACYFEDCCVSEGIGDGGFVGLFILVLLTISFRLEVVNVGEADGPLGFVILAGVVVLVGLARAEDVKLEGGGLQGGRLRLG
jgi:hypothetical protein